MDINFADKMASILSSLTIIIGTIAVALTFRYKFDSEIRNLYIKNCEKICDALDELTRTGNVTNEMYNQILLAFLDAQIYLHKDIVDFTDDIRKKIIDLQTKQMESENLKVGEKRSQNYKESCDIKIYLDNKRKEARKFYRKHIVSEPFVITKKN